MTRKHFEALARAIRAIADDWEREQNAQSMADLCQKQNPRFDRARFYAACNVGGAS